MDSKTENDNSSIIFPTPSETEKQEDGMDYGDTSNVKDEATFYNLAADTDADNFITWRDQSSEAKVAAIIKIEYPQTSTNFQNASKQIRKPKIKRQVTKNDTKCNICKRKLSTKSHLKEHMLIHSTNRERSYQCSTCDKKFFTKIILTKHIQTHNRNPKSFQCEICSHKVSNESTLKNHIRSKHFGEKLAKIPCLFCDKMMLNSADMNEHYRKHTHEKPYFCQQCDRGFSIRSNLLRHLKTHSSSRERKFSCKFCSSKFFTNYELKLHQRVHSGEKTYECKTCNKSFGTSSDLSRHKRIHTGIKPFDCKVCGKCFSESYVLKTHMGVHLITKKLYKCTICQKSYKFKGGLTEHMKIHAKVKKYECHLCSKRFAQNTGLKYHLNTHSSEKRYQCRLCGKSFNQISNCKRHERDAAH